jgi:hypothetical protein
MIPQENIETEDDWFVEEEDFFDEEYFQDWLEAVRIMLETQIDMELPVKRWQELDAYILLRKPAQTVARELVDQLPDSLIEELSDKPMESLVEELFKKINDYLVSSIIRAMIDWLEKEMWKAAKEGSGPYPTKSPDDMAWHLLGIMMDKSNNAIFCPPEALPAIQSGKVNIRRYFENKCASCEFSSDQSGFFTLLARAHAVRFHVAGMAAIMLYNKIRERKTINEEDPSGQN